MAQNGAKIKGVLCHFANWFPADQNPAGSEKIQLWYDFVPKGIILRGFWDWEIKVSKIAENLRKDFDFFWVECDCFFHALSIPRIHHEWEKYVPVHELDSSCCDHKKSSRACDSCTTGYNSTEILFTYWSNFANLNDNALRSFSSSVTITGWP